MDAPSRSAPQSTSKHHLRTLNRDDRGSLDKIVHVDKDVSLDKDDSLVEVVPQNKKILEEIITKFPVVPLSSTSPGTTHKKLSTEEFLAGIYQSKETSSDLERYSLFPTLSHTEGFCLLDWWSNCEAEYPILSRAVKQILSIPASSTASERTFSITKHQTGAKRSSWTKENFSKSSFIACNRHLVNLTWINQLNNSFS